MPFFVYILYSEKCGKYYVGHSDNLQQRISDHNLGKGGNYTSRCTPWQLVYSENFESRAEAVKREMEIKRKKRRTYIEWLITNKSQSVPQ
jgi:predicted GIY-YIG superfamily endonuclease